MDDIPYRALQYMKRPEGMIKVVVSGVLRPMGIGATLSMQNLALDCWMSVTASAGVTNLFSLDPRTCRFDHFPS
jgi:hypothetical protein